MTQKNDLVWESVSISQLCTFERGKENNMASLAEGEIPLVSARKVNNGIKGFVACPSKIIEGGKVLSLNNDGDGGAGLAFYQPFDFALDSHVTALHLKNNLSAQALIFMAACISKQHAIFGHGYSISLPRAKRILSMLPVKDSGSPDFQYMDDYISGLRDKLLERYNEYLIKKIKVLGDLVAIIPLNKKQWKDFALDEIFTISAGKRLETRNKVPGNRPFIGATDNKSTFTSGEVDNITKFIDKDDNAADKARAVNYDTPTMRVNNNYMDIEDKNYLENDKTRSAIMLTGAWGCGKSYYIQNVLTKELNKCNHDVAIVSLYGLKTIAELNKSIYLELRAKRALKKLASKKKNKETKKSNKLFNWIKKHGKEAASGTALVGKTIIKGVAGFFNVPVEFSDKDLEKLYTSINLNGKLIVLEDLERSGIDIIEIMGYVNNLVEQDGVKVLLVANESEIIKSKNDIDGERDDIVKLEKEVVDRDKQPILTEKTQEYIKIKEKTVFDTIKINVGQSEAVKEIISGFDCKYFKQLLDNNTGYGKKFICDTVVDIMDMLEIYNLRAIIFACQKTEDLFNKVAEKIEIAYFETVFCSIIAFALRLSANSNLVWENDATSPVDLGVYAFPLYKFVYNFIKNHFIYEQDAVKTQQAFIAQKKLEIKQEKAKNALNTIYYAFVKSESEVTEAVNTICNYLADIDVIPIIEYGKLGNYLIAIKKIISDTTIIDLCKEKILTNIQEAELNDNQKIALEVHDGIELELPEEKVEYEDFSKKIVECINRQSVRALSTINDANGVKSLIDTISTNHGQFLSNHSLMNGINVGGLLHALPYCTSAQISELRGAIMSFYRAANIAEFLSGDKDALEELQIDLQKIIDDNIIKDKVVLQQIKWFAKDVSNIIYGLKQG